MNAGAMHGIMDGEIFAVYKDRQSASKGSPLAEVTTSAIMPYSSNMTASSGNRELRSGVATKIRAGKTPDLSLHISIERGQKKQLECVAQAFEAIRTNKSSQLRIAMVDEEVAELIISAERGQIVATVKDPSLEAHRMTRIYHQIEPTVPRALDFLRAAAHYHRHLRRFHGLDANGLLDKITIQFTKLETKSLEQGLGPTEPLTNLIKGGVVELTVDTNSIYGIKVINNSEIPLYASIFFFESSDFAISTSFVSPTACL